MKYFVMFCASIVSMILMFIFADGVVRMDSGPIYVLFYIGFIANFMGIVVNAVKVLDLLDKAEKK